ncbi:MAG: hypothetical protein AB8I40_09525 [Anaerolineales bacterium]|jgi:hypothetical protein
MSTSTKHSSFFLILAVILCFSVILSGCGQALLSQPDSGSGEEGAFDEIDLSGASEDSSGAEGEDSEGESSDSGDISPVMAHCPAEPMAMNLVVNHTWDFSPNRDLEKMQVNGSTGAIVFCPLTVHKDQVTMKDCYFPVTNTGFINTDSGPCDIQATGGAILSLDDGYCKDGVVTLMITETVDADVGLSGAMNCPKTSQPYFAFYPPSINTLTFPIGPSPAYQTEDMDPDLTNQYRYHKEWSLYSPDIPSPESEE